jgi:hypothetical protein
MLTKKGRDVSAYLGEPKKFQVSEYYPTEVSLAASATRPISLTCSRPTGLPILLRLCGHPDLAGRSLSR